MSEGCVCGKGGVVVAPCGSVPAIVGVLDELQGRIKLSVGKHGGWEAYSSADVFEKIAGEFDEYREAFVSRQVLGRHGQISELYDVAVTAIKGIVRLTEMEAGGELEINDEAAGDVERDLSEAAGVDGADMCLDAGCEDV